MARGRKRPFLIDDHSASKKAVSQHVLAACALGIAMIARTLRRGLIYTPTCSPRRRSKALPTRCARRIVT
jgi:hypothetical protein